MMISLLPHSTFSPYSSLFFFFFNDTATTEIYTLSLHDALPIWAIFSGVSPPPCSWLVVTTTSPRCQSMPRMAWHMPDRKSTRLNSSHQIISYAVFCLKKKKHTSELQSQQEISYAVFCLKKTTTYYLHDQ